MLHCPPPEHAYHFSEYFCSQVSCYLLSIEDIELQALIKDPFTLETRLSKFPFMARYGNGKRREKEPTENRISWDGFCLSYTHCGVKEIANWKEMFV